jgi:hypothetical protein
MDGPTGVVIGLAHRHPPGLTPFDMQLNDALYHCPITITRVRVTPRGFLRGDFYREHYCLLARIVAKRTLQ